MANSNFIFDEAGLRHAVELLGRYQTVDGGRVAQDLEGPSLPEHGLGGLATLDALAPLVLGRARRLGTPTAFAHMDPPTPWIAWATTLWTAALNQNLLHPDTAPVARELERQVVGALAPFFGMSGGHMTPGSTVANLTALWAARDIAKVETVIASQAAHISIAKSAHILGLRLMTVGCDATGALDPQSLPDDLSRACLVLTAGTTSTGAVDPLRPCQRAAWTHVDAAWAGPLRLSPRFEMVLEGITAADSVAVSAHKWLFQPKESALVLFRDAPRADAALSFGGAYLAVPNVGLLGSHGAVAVPLLATMMAMGRDGMAASIEQAMQTVATLYDQLAGTSDIEVFSRPSTGVLLWRPKSASVDAVRERLPIGLSSKTVVHGRDWVRHVAANPAADAGQIYAHIRDALRA
jgi:L-2,4-diaminobutyrate decarboxylase